jgi:anti-sigma regulatory factor (Ser/Thr protein kinase)
MNDHPIYPAIPPRRDRRDVAFADLFGGAEGGGPVVFVSSRFDSDRLEEGLRAPFSGSCECEGTPPLPVGEVFRRHLTGGGLGMWLRSDTAQMCDVAVVFADAVCRRLLTAEECVSGLCLALHEAVANAIIHGNLEIASPANDPESFATDCRLMDERLEDGAWAARHVEISAVRLPGGLEVAVRNEGPGYRPVRRRPATDRRHGLTIMGEVAKVIVAEEGRLAVLHFPVGLREAE